MVYEKGSQTHTAQTMCADITLGLSGGKMVMKKWRAQNMELLVPGLMSARPADTRPTSPEETLLSAGVHSRRAGGQGTFSREGKSGGPCLSGWPWYKARSPWNPGTGISCTSSPCWLMSHLRGRWPASRTSQGGTYSATALALGCHYICTPS